MIRGHKISKTELSQKPVYEMASGLFNLLINKFPLKLDPFCRIKDCA